MNFVRILEVEIVGTCEPNEKLAQVLADVVGEVLKTPQNHTWVKLHLLPGHQYAENTRSPLDLSPVFVSVLMARWSDSEEMKRIASGLAATFAKILNRPEENGGQAECL